MNTGDAAVNSTYPDGWITWINAYDRYKVLAARIDVFVLPQNQGTRRQALLGVIPFPNDASTLTGGPKNWIKDPRCKMTSLDLADNGRVDLNMPTMSFYFKPRDF